MKPMCSKCGKFVCNPPSLKRGEEINLDDAPPFCPMKIRRDVLEKALSEYNKEVKELARLASIQEAECYERTDKGLRTIYPRVEELVLFSRKMGYKKLGIAFCSGLREEARILTEILENKGFKVISICCKTGAVSKEKIGVKPEEQIRPPELFETMCNPIAQAFIMNEEKVDLAVMLGLCIGHDTLFIKYCKVPITVLVVKDRVFGHNPVMGLYLSRAPYYRRLLSKA